MSRRASLRSQVWAFVRDNPGTCARAVAREVLGGTGNTRTVERSNAHSLLGELEKDGHVTADRDALPYSWYIVLDASRVPPSSEGPQ